MIAGPDEKKLLFKIAKAYYEDGLTQEQIGKRLGLSRIKVSRLLQRVLPASRRRLRPPSSASNPRRSAL